MSEVPLYVPQVRVDGVLPAGAIFRVTFPSVVLLNDAWSPPNFVSHDVLIKWFL
jgi:hypothetical protein